MRSSTIQKLSGASFLSLPLTTTIRLIHSAQVQIQVDKQVDSFNFWAGWDQKTNYNHIQWLVLLSWSHWQRWRRQNNVFLGKGPFCACRRLEPLVVCANDIPSFATAGWTKWLIGQVVVSKKNIPGYIMRSSVDQLCAFMEIHFIIKFIYI